MRNYAFEKNVKDGLMKSDKAFLTQEIGQHSFKANNENLTQTLSWTYAVIKKFITLK